MSDIARRPDGSAPEPMRLGFHFDVMCPWAYQTSTWIREVRESVPLDIDWRFFSLEEINREEGKKHPWEREWSYGWGMMRVAAKLRGSRWRPVTASTRPPVAPSTRTPASRTGRRWPRRSAASSGSTRPWCGPPSTTPAPTTTCTPTTTPW